MWEIKITPWAYEYDITNFIYAEKYLDQFPEYSNFF